MLNIKEIHNRTLKPSEEDGYEPALKKLCFIYKF